jgi:hypothetical protein
MENVSLLILSALVRDTHREETSLHHLRLNCGLILLRHCGHCRHKIAFHYRNAVVVW